jgi:hypothetical protein
MWGYKPVNSDYGRSTLDFQIVKSIPKRPRGPIRLEREAWNAIIWAGGPAMPSGCDL